MARGPYRAAKPTPSFPKQRRRGWLADGPVRFNRCQQVMDSATSLRYALNDGGVGSSPEPFNVSCSNPSGGSDEAQPPTRRHAARSRSIHHGSVAGRTDGTNFVAGQTARGPYRTAKPTPSLPKQRRRGWLADGPVRFNRCQQVMDSATSLRYALNDGGWIVSLTVQRFMRQPFRRPDSQ